jgi:Cu+-exporting ATPase
MPERQVTLSVRGMTCANCAAKVQRALRGVDGVRDANVNLARGVATVTFVPDATGPASGSTELVEVFRQAVVATGYQVL